MEAAGGKQTGTKVPADGKVSVSSAYLHCFFSFLCSELIYSF